MITLDDFEDEKLLSSSQAERDNLNAVRRLFGGCAASDWTCLHAAWRHVKRCIWVVDAGVAARQTTVAMNRRERCCDVEWDDGGDGCIAYVGKQVRSDNLAIVASEGQSACSVSGEQE